MPDEQFRVLISDEMASDAEKLMVDAGLAVDVITGQSPEQLAGMIGAYHGLAVRSATKVTPAILEAASNLKIVGRAGVGVDNINLAAATAKKVQVINTPAGNGTAAGELAIAHMFALARKVPQATASTKAGKWEKKKFGGVEITGKTFGVVGFGNIGRQVAARGVGLKMNVLAYDPFLPEGAQAPDGVTFSSLDALIESSDFITLHLPLTDSTRHLFGADALRKMKAGAYLINCARGGIVDESALLAVLKDGHLAGAALDVFEEEPAGASPLFELDNVIATPHIGASTKEAQYKVAVELAEIFVEFFKSGVARNPVNKL